MEERWKKVREGVGEGVWGVGEGGRRVVEGGRRCVVCGRGVEEVV